MYEMLITIITSMYVSGSHHCVLCRWFILHILLVCKCNAVHSKAYRFVMRFELYIFAQGKMHRACIVFFHHVVLSWLLIMTRSSLHKNIASSMDFRAIDLHIYSSMYAQYALQGFSRSYAMAYQINNLYSRIGF